MGSAGGPARPLPVLRCGVGLQSGPPLSESQNAEEARVTRMPGQRRESRAICRYPRV